MLIPEAPQSAFTDRSLIQMSVQISSKTMPAMATAYRKASFESSSVCCTHRRADTPRKIAPSLTARAMANRRRLGTSKR